MSLRKDETVEVGEVVIVYTGASYSKMERIGEVIKKTPSGLIDVKLKGIDVVIRFNSSGWERTQDPYHRAFLSKATPEDIKAIEERHLRGGINKSY